MLYLLIMEKKSIACLAESLGIDKISFAKVDDYIYYEKYFYKQNEFRDIRSLFSNAKTVVSALLSYNYEWNIPADKPGCIAEYTSANFYKILSKKLDKLAKGIKRLSRDNCRNDKFYRIFVNSKLNDKLAAYSGGLGYIARNSLVTNAEYGSKFVIGSILLNIDIDPDLVAAVDLCKDCRACLNACPTGALSDKKVVKGRCLQYISSSLDFNYDLIKEWGTRFYGCEECRAVCPYNQNLQIKDSGEELIGFVGNNFDLNNLFIFKKGDYKNYFKNNQIGAGWIDEVILARNCLASFYNIDRKFVEKYLKEIELFGWNAAETEYLKNVCKI
ncbi:MAG TPA: 4Fe-4S double cluster binding domain-containing protein, partial [Spirochaetota bacterium]|nr:4Fe-4S double cluster binding domain-containing protein [Spirochaetota bacterium]